MKGTFQLSQVATTTESARSTWLLADTRSARVPITAALSTPARTSGVLISITPELSDHGQRQQRFEFTPDVHRCPWFAPVILGFLSHVTQVALNSSNGKSMGDRKQIGREH